MLLIFGVDLYIEVKCSKLTDFFINILFNEHEIGRYCVSYLQLLEVFHMHTYFGNSNIS